MKKHRTLRNVKIDCVRVRKRLFAIANDIRIRDLRDRIIDLCNDIIDNDVRDDEFNDNDIDIIIDANT